MISSESEVPRAMEGQEDKTMTVLQRKAVGVLFYLYGNAGPHYTKGNHEYLRRILEDEADAEHFQPTDACKDAVAKVMAGDWTPLPPRVQGKFVKMAEEHNRMREAAGIIEGEIR